MQIKDDDYCITYDPHTAIVRFDGSLSLRDMDKYASITRMLDRVLAANHSQITLDIRSLRFLNSAGVNMLFQFVIKMQEQTRSDLILRGSKKVLWQEKSLKNMLRLKPEARLIME